MTGDHDAGTSCRSGVFVQDSHGYTGTGCNSKVTVQDSHEYILVLVVIMEWSYRTVMDSSSCRADSHSCSCRSNGSHDGGRVVPVMGLPYYW